MTAKPTGETVKFVRRGCRDLDPDWPGIGGEPRGPVLCVSYPRCSCGEEDANSPPRKTQTMTDLKALRAIAEAATQPSPWTMIEDNVDGSCTVLDASDMWVAIVGKAPADAEFIAAFNPAQASALLDEVERLRKLLGEATKIAAEWIELGIPDDDAQQAAYRIEDIRKEAGIDE